MKNKQKETLPIFGFFHALPRLPSENGGVKIGPTEKLKWNRFISALLLIPMILSAVATSYEDPKTRDKVRLRHEQIRRELSPTLAESTSIVQACALPKVSEPTDGETLETPETTYQKKRLTDADTLRAIARAAVPDAPYFCAYREQSFDFSVKKRPLSDSWQPKPATRIFLFLPSGIEIEPIESELSAARLNPSVRIYFPDGVLQTALPEEFFELLFPAFDELPHEIPHEISHEVRKGTDGPAMEESVPSESQSSAKKEGGTP